MLHTVFNIFLFLFVIILLILGITELIKQIVQKAYKGQNSNPIIIIFPINEATENIEYTLRSIAAKIRWTGNFTPQKVICLDCGLSESQRKTCEIICKEYGFIELMNKDEFYDYTIKINQR
ncbi:MAG: hypothetical protein E7566_03070 [Ruminococcaceae bacterium]|nr:hypothetical protein [Oscillospiraceae bacterium]